MIHEDLLQEKLDAFHQRLVQHLQQHNPDLLHEWNDIQELQNLPKRLEDIKHHVEECLLAIRHAGLTPLWKAFEDMQQLAQDDDLQRQAQAIEQFIKDVDEKIHLLKEELERDDRNTLSYWKKHGVSIFEVRDGDMKKT